MDWSEDGTLVSGSIAEIDGVIKAVASRQRYRCLRVMLVSKFVLSRFECRACLVWEWLPLVAEGFEMECFCEDCVGQSEGVLCRGADGD